MPIYIGVDDKARNVVAPYIGVSGKARGIKKAWVGDANGKAREIYSYVKNGGVARVELQLTSFYTQYGSYYNWTGNLGTAKSTYDSYANISLSNNNLTCTVKGTSDGWWSRTGTYAYPQYKVILKNGIVLSFSGQYNENAMGIAINFTCRNIGNWSGGINYTIGENRQGGGGTYTDTLTTKNSGMFATYYQADGYWSGYSITLNSCTIGGYSVPIRFSL